MKLLFTICARAGSKGLKNKNISEFLGVPLCCYTLAAYKLFCEKHPEFDIALAVNTDSDELVKQVKMTNIPFTHVVRKPELAGDAVGKMAVIKDTYKEMGGDFDYLIDLDLTSPLRTVEDIEGVFTTLINNPDANVSFSMTHSRRSPYFNQVKKFDRFYSTVLSSNCLSRQEVQPVYDMNASIYAYAPDFLTNPNIAKVFDGRAVGYIMKDTAVLDIDNPEDKDLMEIVATYFFKNYREMNLVQVLANEIYKNII